MMEIFEGIINVKGALFVRPAMGKKVILAAVVPEWRKNHNELDELWLADIQITVGKKFKVPESYAGHRMDQVLCSTMRPNDFEEIT